MKRILTDKELHSMANAAPVNTHSAREPAYKYTMLCPDPRYRPGGELYGKVGNNGDRMYDKREVVDGQGNTSPVLRDERGNQGLAEADRQAG
ncbi:MAG: hypothetical protein ACRDBO_11515 [Lachnospiraceae bacterium]